MAKGSQKRIAAANARAVSVLAYGFAVTNTVFLLSNFWMWRSPASTHWTNVTLYAVTEAIAALLGYQLTSMARAGDDLAQPGLTAYMFDIVYITWFVHVTTSLVSRYLWWFYAVIPGYIGYLLCVKVLLPFVFRRGAPASAVRTSSAAPSATEPTTSKRQAKQQARMSRGRPGRRM